MHTIFYLVLFEGLDNYCSKIAFRAIVNVLIIYKFSYSNEQKSVSGSIQSGLAHFSLYLKHDLFVLTDFNGSVFPFILCRTF